MRELTEEEVQEEAGFIEDVARWPLWPLLPVKHVNRGDQNHPDDEQVGVMTADDLTTVWFRNLYELKSGEPIAKGLEGARKVTFDSTTDLVRAGWIGD